MYFAVLWSRSLLVTDFKYVAVQSLSLVRLFVGLVDCSTPGPSVLCCLLEFARTRVHRVGDAIQPPHPLPPPSPLALSLSQHQGLFQ